ncbi:protein nullo [Drosophila albomicans]|uniref:Protein nullo n=1 Tax=Drosophila albomicans TaxID=7291 RepID=A0A6P8W5X8_DROAB|nr:protein nullo [Drosophila albomicans]
MGSSTSSSNGSSDCSSSATSSTTGSSSSSMPSNCNCCVAPRFGFKRLLQKLQKLRRSIKRHLRPRKNRCGFQRRYGARTALLRPMPRCSSFGSCGTLLTPTKRAKATPTDTHYAQWKCTFEHARGSKKYGATAAATAPHDISEALSGQTTPRGFPSHTDARRCSQQLQQLQQQQQQQLQPVVEQPLYEQAQVRRRLSFRLPLSRNSSSSGSSGIGGSSSGGGGGTVRRLTARQRAAQAKLEAQLQRELRDLEDYYGGFHYARRNERRI